MPQKFPHPLLTAILLKTSSHPPLPQWYQIVPDSTGRLLSCFEYWCKFSAGLICLIMGEETVGFSSLFSKLCELSFNNEATKGWDIYRRPRYTDHRRRALKRCLYETLFEELRAPWVGKLVHSQEKSGNLKSSSPKSVLNKFSTRAFELRLARKFDDADRLDHFLRQWRSLQGL